MLDELSGQEGRALEERVVRALDRVPEVKGMIPEDFAAKVASRAPAREVRLTPTHTARNVTIVCVVVLMLAIVGLAMSNREQSLMVQAVEWCLFAQLLLMSVWLGTRSWGER
jgi:hypothetical protein